MANGFVHLHTHTQYSLLDGACRIPELVSRAKELGQTALAITDHGAMYGVVEFYKECLHQGVKPIIGCEVYVSPRGMRDKVYEYDAENYHLVLLAKDQTGYANLMKLVSLAYIDGFYYKPRVDKAALSAYGDGLIALSACLGGEIPQRILQRDIDGAASAVREYQQLFPGRFYLELQNHGLAGQDFVNQTLATFSQEYGVPLVATNDVHYIRQEDSFYQDVLMCIQTGKTVNDENRMKMGAEEFYLKSEEQMQQALPEYEEALLNTARIAQMCNVEIEFGHRKFPVYKTGENDGRLPGESAAAFLRRLCQEGLKRRYEEIMPAISDRMEYELSVIESMGYCDYFLIVWDFIKYAKDHGISVGPGRGSAAGSLVAYCLQITDVDPIRFSLLFERFLNPERISMPDIDVDFCYVRRQEVIDYVVEKYGADRVAQIITFGTMAARAAVRDCGRALDMPYAEVDEVAKQIPTMPLHITLDGAMEANATLRKMVLANPRLQQLWETAKAVEGLPRHASTHAAGVVITEEPVYCYVPMQRNDDVLTTQYTMTELEELGLLKMDFLGLRTLTVIRDAADFVKKYHGIELDIDHLDLSDQKVYKMLSAGDTDGVFQLESAGMRSFLRDLMPSNIEDIVAALALYRPGPMDQIPRYIENKKHPEAVTYLHPLLKPILSVTYGCIVYQEQVMQIVRELGGYSLGRADLVRRAMAKKKADVMEVEYKNFVYGIRDEQGNYVVDGAVRRGIPEETAKAIFDEILSFANYAFNKAHAVAYAQVAYQTAYLKAHYPTEFMAALMTSVLYSASKIAQYQTVLSKMGIRLLPPDINISGGTFTPYEKNINYGLYAVKNVGRNLVDEIVRERERGGPYKGFSDFCARVDSPDRNKRAVLSLIKSGCFDRIAPSRRVLLATFEQMMDSADEYRRSNLTGQTDLFSLSEGDGGDSAAQDAQFYAAAGDLAEFPQKDLFAMEKEVMGVYLSGHPLDAYAAYFKNAALTPIVDLLVGAQEPQDEPGAFSDGDTVTIGGMVAKKSVKAAKNGKFITFVTLEDRTGSIEVVVFHSVLERCRDLILEDAVLKMTGRVQLREDEEPKLICDRVERIRPEQGNQARMRLYIRVDEQSRANLPELSPLLAFYRGDTPVYLYDAQTKKTQVAAKNLWVSVNQNLLEELSELFGRENVKVVPVAEGK